MKKEMRILILGSEDKDEYELGLFNQLKSMGYNTTYISISSVIIKMGLNNEVLYKNKNIINSYDVIVPFIADKDIDFFKYILDEAEKNNVYLFSSGRAIFFYSNYLHFIRILDNNNIHVPETYIAKNKKAVSKYLDEITYPILLKIPDKKSEIVVKSRESASSILDTIEVLKKPLILQQIPFSYDRLRILVLGSKIYAFNVNKKEKITLPSKDKRTVEKIKRIINSKMFEIKAYYDENNVLFFDDLIIRPNFEDFLEFYPKIGINLIKDLSFDKGIISQIMTLIKMRKISNSIKKELFKK